MGVSVDMLGPWRRIAKILAMERFECGDWLGLKVGRWAKSSRHEVTRNCDGSTDSISLRGDEGPMYAGSGLGVAGPIKESESPVDSSEGGACDADSLLAKTLAHMKRCVPVFASGAPWTDSSVEIDCFLASGSVATEGCLEGSIKP